MRSLFLLAATCLSSAGAALPATTVLTLQSDPIPGQPGKNYCVIDIEVRGPDITTSNTQSTLSGTVEGYFEVEAGNTSVMTLANGVVTATDFSASGTVSVFTFTGPYTLNASEFAGTFETPNPPGILSAPGEFDANQHRLTVNQGSVNGSALGQTLSSVYSPSSPFTGSGSGTGTVTLTPAGSSGIYNLFDVVVIVPGIVATDSIVVGTGPSTTVTVEGTVSIKAAGTLEVPKSDYIAWTINYGIDGADGQADVNNDGIPNAISWALGLGAFDNARNYVLKTANGGYQIQLPPSGTVAPLSIEGSDLATAFAPISSTRISALANPLPPGSTGLITINRVADEFLRMKIEE